MPLAKLTCPKCHATLKPAKPVPEGKTVKCPKCEETFRAGGKSSEDIPEKPAKKAAAAQSEEAEEEEAATYALLKDDDEEKKKAEAEERKRRKKKRKRDDDDDEDEDEDEEDDEEEEDDVTAQYLKNLKPRDPRGAAQETVVGPANWLLRTALIAFFGWVGYFVAFMLPVAFPNIDKKEDVPEFAQPAQKEKDKKKEKQQAVHWWSADTILDEENRPWSVVLFVFVLLLGLAQAAVLANASVKMQSLESYNWGLWGCIIAIIPLATFPWFVFITYVFDLFDWLIELGMDETCWMIGLIAFVWCPIVGGICLKKILEPQVKPGFEYKPD
jgi:hypothetical protein